MSLLQNRLVTVVLYICYGLRTFPGFAALYAPLVNRIAHRDLPNEGVSIPPAVLAAFPPPMNALCCPSLYARVCV